MKNSKLIYIMLMIISLLLISACVYDDKTDKEETESKAVDLSSANLIRVGAISYPPYYYFEDGEFKGEFAKVAIEAFDRMDINYEIKEYPWARMHEMLKVGDLDMLLDVYITEERLEYLDFSSEKYISYNEVFFKLKDTEIDFTGDFNELSDYKIGVVNGFYYGDSFDKALDDGILDVEIVSSFEQSILKLINQRTDIIVSAEIIGEKVVKELGYSDVIEAMEPYVNSADSYFAFSKVNELKDLRVKLDEILVQMRKEGIID